MQANALVQLVSRAKVRDWKVSVNGGKGKPVLHGSVRLILVPLGVRVEFVFEEEGVTRTLSAVRRISDPVAEVELNGAGRTGRMEMQPHYGLFGVKLEVTVEGEGMPRYRFDGKARLS